MVIGGILITISDTWSLVMFAISFCNVSSNQHGDRRFTNHNQWYLEFSYVCYQFL